MRGRGRHRQWWFVYLIECCDGTLYTGVALDVNRRVAEHNAGRGGRYTRGRVPVRMVAASGALEKRAAYRLEWQLKQLRAREKAAVLRASRRKRRTRGRRAAKRKARVPGVDRASPADRASPDRSSSSVDRTMFGQEDFSSSLK